VNGKLEILEEGTKLKFIEQVEQVTFSGKYAIRTGQRVLYITERCVFELKPEGLCLLEIAPGIDLKRDILDQMGFEPQIPEKLALMDSRLFREEKMGLA
jgi:propionate CoA-transferase